MSIGFTQACILSLRQTPFSLVIKMIIVEPWLISLYIIIAFFCNGHILSFESMSNDVWLYYILTFTIIKHDNDYHCQRLKQKPFTWAHTFTVMQQHISNDIFMIFMNMWIALSLQLNQFLPGMLLSEVVFAGNSAKSSYYPAIHWDLSELTRSISLSSLQTCHSDDT